MSSLIEVQSLKKYFSLKEGFLSRSSKIVHAVDDISFSIKKGETLALVGESGCGKTTTGRLILRLVEPTAGHVFFQGKDIFGLTHEEMRNLRRQMQIIFQDPFASLNPRKKVRQILWKAFRLADLPKDEIEGRITDLLEVVGLSPVEEYINRFPHEFSGGQRQRIGIARALAPHPGFVVADEPVSALDLSVRAQILKLMKRLQEEFSLTYLFITHDLAVVRSTCNRVVVMYLGKILELAEVDELFENAFHPYTEAILSATPIPNPRSTRRRKRIVLKGEVPSPINPPAGCRFHTRCPFRTEKCAQEEPELIDVGNSHLVACWQRT